MTKSVKLSLKLSQTREKINELASLETRTEEQDAEIVKLRSDAQETEKAWREAVEVEEKEAEERDITTQTAEEREISRLLARTSAAEYIRHAASESHLTGVPAELNAAYKCDQMFAREGGLLIPHAVLLADQERADVATTTAQLDGPVMQNQILQKLYGMSISDILGVRMDSVGIGRREYPLLSTGATIGVKEESAAQDATQATFAPQTLKPKRLTGSFTWTYEMAAEVPGVEAALRQNIMAALHAKIADQFINGDGSGANVTGILARLDNPDDPTAEADYAAYAKTPASAVDGIHANMEQEVSILLGVTTYQHAAGKLQAGSGESATEALKRRCHMCQATSYLPAAAGNVQTAILHAGMDSARGDSIAAMWPAIEIIRDRITKAAEGEVKITAIQLWDAYMAFRAPAYKRIEFKLA